VRIDSTIEPILAEALRDEGLQVGNPPIASAEQLVGDPPDLLVLGAGPHSEAVQLIDALREHPETVALPVIVLGTMPSLQQQAQASGNVYAALAMPFELDELVEAVSGALARVPFEARVQELPVTREMALQRASELLLGSERELMLGWVQRVQTLEPFRNQPGIGLHEFLNSMPRLLNALAVALSRDKSAELLADDDDLQARVREHARLRMRQGVPGEAVVREYQVLRDAIHKHLGRHLAAEDALKALERLSWFLDEVIRRTVAEYLRLTRDASDH
jgi:response regulator RpfG family c-di-GMP phosphodiesterase